MISKELLSKVLDVEVTYLTDDYSEGLFPFQIANVDGWATINIHELAYKCKEWALTEDYILKTHSLKSHSICTVIRIIEESPYIDTIGIYNLPTEPEAIFKACEWILQRRNDIEV